MSLIINTLGDEVSIQRRQNKELMEIIDHIVIKREEPPAEEIKSEMGVNMQKMSKQVSTGEITSLEKEISPVLNKTNIIQQISEKAASVQKAIDKIIITRTMIRTTRTVLMRDAIIKKFTIRKRR